MRRMDIIKELENRGFEVTAEEYKRKGVEMEGIRVRRAGSSVTIMVGMKKDECNWDNPELVENIISEYDEKSATDYMERITSREFMEKHIFIGLQRESKEEDNMIKSSSGLDGIEAYLYLDLEEEAMRVAESLIARAGIKKSEAWKMAEKNTLAETKILSPGSVLAMMTGLPYDESLEEVDGLKFYMVTNNRQYRGAASVLNLDAIREKVGKKVIVLPSSVHEVLVLPVEEDEEIDLDMYSQMVRDVNTTVEEEIQLSDRAYLLSI